MEEYSGHLAFLGAHLFRRRGKVFVFAREGGGWPGNYFTYIPGEGFPPRIGPPLLWVELDREVMIVSWPQSGDWS